MVCLFFAKFSILLAIHYMLLCTCECVCALVCKVVAELCAMWYIEFIILVQQTNCSLDRH